MIGPSIQVQLQQVKEGGFKNFMCACNALFKDEPSYRAHSNATHKQINDMVCQFADVIKITSLHRIDFALLGDTTPHEEYKEFLGKDFEQKTRLIKWMKIREVIRHSDITVMRSAEDFRKTREQHRRKKRLVQKEFKRRAIALDIINNTD